MLTLPESHLGTETVTWLVPPKIHVNSHTRLGKGAPNMGATAVLWVQKNPTNQAASAE